ncbi:hypothetical protein AHF37_11837 [Paragonimus kellicotti]|nr:hypothetical protein AHF37_11837 [Paragonimus kellicotti]
MVSSDCVIPDAPWYFGEIGRVETNEILIDQPVGTYLVRDSTTQSGYALDVKEANGVKRYLISYIPSSKKFRFGDFFYDSFEDLIRQPAPKPVYIGCIICKVRMKRIFRSPEVIACTLFDKSKSGSYEPTGRQKRNVSKMRFSTLWIKNRQFIITRFSG